MFKYDGPISPGERATHMRLDLLQRQLDALDLETEDGRAKAEVLLADLYDQDERLNAPRFGPAQPGGILIGAEDLELEQLKAMREKLAIIAGVVTWMLVLGVLYGIIQLVAR